MIYAYDLLVNLNNKVYDFYDWKSTDKITHIRRVPLFKVSVNTYLDILEKNVRLNLEILPVIKDKTQVFTAKVLELINYALVITNGVNALFIVLDSKGNVKEKSKFLVNEELEIIDLSNKLKTTTINYKVISNSIYNKMIRSEKETIKTIINELSNIKEDKDKIDYLYYEWFKDNNGINKYDKLIKDINSKFTSKHLEFLEILKLICINK